VDSSFCCDRQRLWHFDADQVAGGVHSIIEADEARDGQAAAVLAA
jgi:hypothetical protein